MTISLWFRVRNNLETKTHIRKRMIKVTREVTMKIIPTVFLIKQTTKITRTFSLISTSCNKLTHTVPSAASKKRGNSKPHIISWASIYANLTLTKKLRKFNQQRNPALIQRKETKKNIPLKVRKIALKSSSVHFAWNLFTNVSLLFVDIHTAKAAWTSILFIRW